MVSTPRLPIIVGVMFVALAPTAHSFLAMAGGRRWPVLTLRESAQPPEAMTLDEACHVLSEFDRNYNTDPTLLTWKSDLDVSQAQKDLSRAILTLNQIASNERANDPSFGRVMMGICASNGVEGLTTLKAWVTVLQLPRGLLHGMDKDGVQIDLDGGVYIKYNSGGMYTFSDIRKSGLGFDSIWKPGDAMLELYDGTYRGVYFQVELSDGVFRQYLVPLKTFQLELE